MICKTDDSIPERLPPEEFVTVDVITCAAPNLRERPWNPYNPGSGSSVNLTKKEQYDIHLKRAKHILHVAAAHGAEIMILASRACFTLCSTILRDSRSRALRTPTPLRKGTCSGRCRKGCWKYSEEAESCDSAPHREEMTAGQI